MDLIVYICLLLIPTAIAITRPGDKCPFKDTVDLTNYTSFENGSYLYHDMLIPKEKVSIFQYRLEFLNKSRSVAGHRRGCVCDGQRGKYCIKLCCEYGQFFNESSMACQSLPDDRNMPTDLDIVLENGARQTVNIFEKFVQLVGLPCPKPEVLSSYLDIWDVLEDGNLLIYSDNALLDTVSYCLTPYYNRNTKKDELMPMSCPMKSEVPFTLLLNTYAMLISVIFIIPTILVYLLLKELRENLRNKILICYLIAMAIGYSIISYINISHTRMQFIPCSIIGFIGYFFLMAAFVWLSVLCFDIWHSFKRNRYELCAKRNAILFAIYSIYAWGLSAMMTAAVIWAQLSSEVDDLYKPGIGIDMCWLDTRKWSSALYFYGPNTLILIFSIATFIYMISTIYRTRCESVVIAQRQNFFQDNAIVLLRLFLIMGISWTMDICSYCLRNYPRWEFVFVLTDFCNAIQGVLIFTLFVLKRKVRLLLQKKLRLKSKSEVAAIQYNSTTSVTTSVW